MSYPDLDPDLATALEALTRAFGPTPPQVLEVRPARRRPTPPPAPAPDGPERQLALFNPTTPQTRRNSL
jgi:hypothetical protein